MWKSHEERFHSAVSEAHMLDRAARLARAQRDYLEARIGAQRLDERSKRLHGAKGFKFSHLTQHGPHIDHCLPRPLPRRLERVGHVYPDSARPNVEEVVRRDILTEHPAFIGQIIDK